MKKTIGQKLRGMGPAAIITSAFVGPGTITTATLAGVKFGYALVWAVLFSGISLIILMEMASRIAIIGRTNAIDASIDTFPGNKAWKGFIKTIVFVAVASVCFAFQAGNEIGASAGLGDIFGLPQWLAAVIVGLLALSAAVLSSYKTLEFIMKIFVGLMGAVFVITMLLVRPSITGIIKGIVPIVPEGGIVNTMALIGTTLIGINLILHSITSQGKWSKEEDLEDAKFDIRLNIMLGVLITLSIVITSGTVLYNSGIEVNSPLVFSKQLEPVMGSWTRIAGDIGLFAAGLSSAIAVPFTLKTIFSRLFGWESSDCTNAKILGAIVVIFGTVLAALNTSPTQIIVFAQATSGFFLPFIAILLVICSNNKRILGKHTNTVLQNVLGGAACIVTLVIGIRGLSTAIMSMLG